MNVEIDLAGRSALELRSLLESVLEQAAGGPNTTDLLDAHARPRPVVLHGAGNLGRMMRESLRRRGVEVVAFEDNAQSAWGTEVLGTPVLSPVSAARLHARGSVLAVAVWNPTMKSDYAGMRADAQARGWKRVIPFHLLADGLGLDVLPHASLDFPGSILPQRSRILAAFDVLGDDRSREEYVAHCAWRLLGSPAPSPVMGQYFPDDVYSVTQDEVFVDCGAYDGDTIRRLLSMRLAFAWIYAFEPDPRNASALSSYVRRLDGPIRSRVSVIEAATGEEDASVPFVAEGTDGSRTRGDGTTMVRQVSLGGGILAHAPTLIKADVEGCEGATLRGAASVIAKARPVLAVCVYHRPHDLWELPLLCRALCEDYVFSLRSHGCDGWECVLYAVPRERSLLV